MKMNKEERIIEEIRDFVLGETERFGEYVVNLIGITDSIIALGIKEGKMFKEEFNLIKTEAEDINLEVLFDYTVGTEDDRFEFHQKMIYKFQLLVGVLINVVKQFLDLIKECGAEVMLLDLLDVIDSVDEYWQENFERLQTTFVI